MAEKLHAFDFNVISI